MTGRPRHHLTDADDAPVVVLRWDSSDHWSFLAPLMAMGVLGAVALAVLGLPPVDVHGPLHYAGVMDPLCGMTRAVRHLARGDVALALRYNPAVVILPAAAAMVGARWTYGRAARRWLHVSVRRSWPLAAAVVIAFAVLWARQQANAELLGP